MSSSFGYRPDEGKKKRDFLIFSICDKVGGLQEVLDVFGKHGVNLTRIESRPSKNSEWDYDFFVDIEPLEGKVYDPEGLQKELIGLGVSLSKSSFIVNSSSTEDLYKSPKSHGLTEVKLLTKNPLYVPWFPRKLADLDCFNQSVLEYGKELDADHPGFHDSEYRKRRAKIVDLAVKYKTGDPIPHIEYTEQENATWRAVYTEVKKLTPTHACKQFNYVLPLLELNCGFSPDKIPQLDEVSKFLADTTGFRLRPVGGLLTSRDFLNGLAFRVFHSTQYIRHHSRPLYTPEPDVCHELIGHVPLFADPAFADFSQTIGLASLGASDEDIERLATCYWFTVEFGLCLEEGAKKAFGAGLLSSFGELKYCLGGDEKKPDYIPFDPEIAGRTKYPVTSYQPTYFVAQSFEHAKNQMEHFASTQMSRPFALRYNPYTQSVEVLNEPSGLVKVIKEIQSKLTTMETALTLINNNISY